MWRSLGKRDERRNDAKANYGTSIYSLYTVTG
jgi:hypothetical protein